MEEGMEIPIWYDPMIAKLITHGSTRAEAIQRMIRAIEDYRITGVQTTLPFCSFVMKHEAFTSGKFDTHFVKKYFSPEMLETINDEEMELAALFAVQAFRDNQSGSNKSKTVPVEASRWKSNRIRFND
jgi:propionyl-CoA carboxylase alpha chain